METYAKNSRISPIVVNFDGCVHWNRNGWVNGPITLAEIYRRNCERVGEIIQSSASRVTHWPAPGDTRRQTWRTNNEHEYKYSHYFMINDNSLFRKIVTLSYKRVLSLTFDFQRGLPFSKRPLKLHRRCAECRVAVAIDSLSSSYLSHYRSFLTCFRYNTDLILKSIRSNAINNIKRIIFLEYLQI